MTTLLPLPTPRFCAWAMPSASYSHRVVWRFQCRDCLSPCALPFRSPMPARSCVASLRPKAEVYSLFRPPALVQP